MYKFKLNLKTVILIGFSFLFFFSFIFKIFAQSNDEFLQIGENGIQVYSFIPTAITDLVKYGPFRILSFFGIIFIGWLTILIIWTLFKTGVNFAQGDKSDVEEGLKASKNLILGFFWFFASFFIFIVISLFIGTGNVMRWPTRLSTCGEYGTLLFRAEFKANELDTDNEIFDEETGYSIYCCEFLKFLPEDESEEDIRTSEKILLQRDYIGVGHKGFGGWLFIKGDRNSTKNANVVVNNECEYFHN